MKVNHKKNYYESLKNPHKLIPSKDGCLSFKLLMKYVCVYHSAEVIDTFVFNQSHCVPVVRPLMVHNNKHSVYYQVHCRTRTTFPHYFQETWHCPERRHLCQWLEKTKSKRLRTFSYEVMQDINNGVQCHWMNLSTAKKKKNSQDGCILFPIWGDEKADISISSFLVMMSF